MYVSVVQPSPPPPSFFCRTFKLGCPAPVKLSPDALTDVLTGVKPAGMAGCGGSCKCGGKCKGLGDVAPVSFFPGTSAASPSFAQQFTNPLGSDLGVLSQQLADLNAQTAAVNENLASSNWGTWVLVGLGGLGAWYAFRSMRGLVRASVPAPVVVKRKRRKKARR